jgi:hypothetical protein
MPKGCLAGVATLAIVTDISSGEVMYLKLLVVVPGSGG